VPFFSELVGLVTAGTYLTVAHTLPALVCLRLMRKSQSWLNTAVQVPFDHLLCSPSSVG